MYAGAGTHVCALLEAAGIPPPPDEELEPPELSQQEKLTKCVTDFKKATNQMKNLVEKKAKLQARADRLKQELEKLIGDVDQVDRDIAAKDGEVQAAAQTFKDLTADSRSPAFSALESVLAEAGHDLSEATRAKMKAALVGKDDLPCRSISPARCRVFMGPPAPTRTATGPTHWTVLSRTPLPALMTPLSRTAGAGS